MKTSIIQRLLFIDSSSSRHHHHCNSYIFLFFLLTLITLQTEQLLKDTTGITTAAALPVSVSASFFSQSSSKVSSSTTSFLRRTQADEELQGQEQLKENEPNMTNNQTNTNSTETTDDDSLIPKQTPLYTYTNTNQRNNNLDPITIKGYKFFNSITGKNVLIKGIDYYPRPNAGLLNINSVDFFTNEYRHIWERDIPFFQELGVNAIRLYSVDPDYDHSDFMCALAQVGIYVLVELASGSCPRCAILSTEVPLCYPPDLKIRGQRVIQEFSKYTNTLAFSAGNEVNHFVPLGKPPQWNAPCLKKFVRDMRAYISHCSQHMRQIPIGLIMADSDREENTLYYNCQSDPKDPYDYAEWYGINTYVYCNGDAQSYDEAKGFHDLSSSFESYHYSIPVLLTEYGCLSKSFPTIEGYQGQRNFNQAKWLGLKSVQNDFAGGFAFEYSIEAANAQTPFVSSVLFL